VSDGDLRSPVELDVVVVGAGLSGVGAGYRLQTECPDLRFAILEARGTIGGTWDLFRYPGIRSDSDMFTLGYPFRPWKGANAIADGASILRYIEDTAREHGIDRHIRFHHRVVSASWSSAAARWTLEVDAGEQRVRYRCRFLYLCTGYYDYEHAHTPEFPGAESFGGRVVHPQWWPDDLEHAGKRVVVIGSGATAITLVPALAERAAHVTMLQRSPSYVLSLPARDRVADLARKLLPAALAHRLTRTKNVLLGQGFYQLCRRFPRAARWLLRRRVVAKLPAGFAVDPHFAPRYPPWDQRMCIVPDDDLFTALASGKAEVVTDTIDRFTATGIRLGSGRELAADVIVTATGLSLLSFGGMRLDVDGRAIDPGESLVFKGLMLAGVPNLAWCVGYVNASWTLRADLSSRYVCRLIAAMDRGGYDAVVPRVDAAGAGEHRPLLDLSSGYVARASDRLPKQGTRAPWQLRQNYVLDRRDMAAPPQDDAGLEFSRAVTPSA
jgi:monooxygenase